MAPKLGKNQISEMTKAYKMTQKLSQNQMSELKETQKMKVVQLHEYTPKQLLNPTQNPK